MHHALCPGHIGHLWHALNALNAGHLFSCPGHRATRGSMLIVMGDKCPGHIGHIGHAQNALNPGHLFLCPGHRASLRGTVARH